jgi:hypothetical protein
MAVIGDLPKKFAVLAIDGSHIRLAQPHCRFSGRYGISGILI